MLGNLTAQLWRGGIGLEGSFKQLSKSEVSPHYLIQLWDANTLNPEFKKILVVLRFSLGREAPRFSQSDPAR